MIAILAGGVGAARFARGISELIEPEQIAVISNVGDDEVLHGLHISPDIDTVIYTLAEAINQETGWGLTNESWRVMESLAEYGGATWFRLGDRDLATHLFRTQLLREGETLTEITDRIRKRWNVRALILPVTDGRLRTVLYHLVDGIETKLSFQEYFVQLAQRPSITRVEYERSRDARATAAVISALEMAEAIVIAPSNPVLSIAPILEVPEVMDMLKRNKNKVVAVSPIIAGRAVKGPAAKLMHELGLGPSAFGVAQYYREIIDAIVIDDADADLAASIEALKIRVTHTNTIMDSVTASKNLANAALGMVVEGSR